MFGYCMDFIVVSFCSFCLVHNLGITILLLLESIIRGVHS